ncbi:aminoglycoside phosphotransferase [Streptomyces sp. NPDC101175]|uniref:aminoglycoside phosphotransferase n=1 Tax=Streptomyces sp. NPDC101175 TaxID=3366123 RepID=UPI003837EF78
MLRLDFEDLPQAARGAVESQTGRIKAARMAGGGINSGIAAFLDTERGRVFVKGIPADHPQAVSQSREVAVAPYLPAASPRLLWHVDAGGWSLLGYSVLVGRHADYGESDDLVLVLDALQEVQQATAPDLVEIKRAEQRWAAYAEPEDAGLFAGTTLLHTDLAPHNILVDERAHIVDWAWPTRGAAFIDPHVLAVRLMQAGHSAERAVSWVRRIPSWREADPAAVAAFSTATVRSWREIAVQDPQPWKVEMAGHAGDLRTFLMRTL